MYAKLKDQMKNSRSVSDFFFDKIYKKKSGLILHADNSKQLRRSLEVGCLRHPGASTIGSQLQDGDCTDGWQNLTTQP